MRVLHVGKFFPPAPGGIETYLGDLIVAQRAAGLDATAVVHGDPQPDDPPWLTRVPVLGHWIHAPIAPGFRATLAQALDRQAPDLLHLHLPNTAALLALSLPEALRRPWIVHWHSDVRVTRRRDLLSLAYEAYRPLELSLLERAARIIATSPPYCNASAALAPFRDKTRVIPLGLDWRRVAAAPPADVTLPWRPGAFRVLALGRLAHYKGFETLIDAVAPLADVHCVIAGDGALRTSLQARAARTATSPADPRVSLLGAVDAPTKQALFASCDLFCLASRERTEAFGLVLLEALAQGKPCLVSDLAGSGAGWVVAQTGGGLTVPTGDVAAWRAAIEALRTDPARRQELGTAGRQGAAARFAIDRLVDAITALYREVLPQPARAPAQAPLLVVPTARVTAAVVDQVAALRAAGWRDVVVVTDTEGTAHEALRAAGAAMLCPIVPLGPWGLLQTGLRYARERGAAGVVVMEAGGRWQAAAVAPLLAGAAGFDLAVAADPGRGGAARRSLRTAAGRLLGLPLSHPTSGFRYFGPRAMALLAEADAGHLHSPHLSTLLIARRHGLRVTEVELGEHRAPEAGWRRFDSLAAGLRYIAGSALLCAAHLRLWPRREASS